MKRILVWLLCAALMVSLVGCGGAKDAPADDDAAVTTTVADEAEGTTTTADDVVTTDTDGEEVAVTTTTKKANGGAAAATTTKKQTAATTGFSAADKLKCEDVEYISNQFVQYEEEYDRFVVAFGLEDANEKFITASGYVKISIVDMKNNEVYNKQVIYTPADFVEWGNDEWESNRNLCSLHIPRKDIATCATSDGVLFLEVLLCNDAGFPVESHAIDNLPVGSGSGGNSGNSGNNSGGNSGNSGGCDHRYYMATCSRCGEKTPNYDDIKEWLEYIRVRIEMLATLHELISIDIQLYELNGDLQEIADIQKNVQDIADILDDIHSFSNRYTEMSLIAKESVIDTPLLITSSSEYRYALDARTYANKAEVHMRVNYNSLCEAFGLPTIQ